MSNAPKVTVVIPTHNTARYLPEAVESVLRQTFADFELLVLDNASTDETPELMARYADPRFRYVRNESNLGLAGNVNRGIELARGELLTYLGADDVWEAGFLAEAVRFLDAEPGVTLVHGPAIWIDEHGRRYGGMGQTWQRITPGRDAMLGAFGSGFCFSTMVMRTAAVRAAAPIDQQWREVIDLWLFLKMSVAGDVGWLDRALVEYRVHDQAMSIPMYRENLMFRRQVAAANEAFSWPAAVAIGAAHHAREAKRQAAIIAMEVLHLSRMEGYRTYLRNLAEIVREVPEILCRPHTWARVAATALLSPSAIRAVQRLRRRRAIAAASTAYPKAAL